MFLGQILQDGHESDSNTVWGWVYSAILRVIVIMAREPAEETAEKSASSRHDEEINTDKALAVFLSKLKPWNQPHYKKCKQVDGQNEIRQLVVDVCQVIIIVVVNFNFDTSASHVDDVQIETGLDYADIGCNDHNEREHC